VALVDIWLLALSEPFGSIFHS